MAKQMTETTTGTIQVKGWFKQHKLALATATLLGAMGSYLLVSNPSVALSEQATTQATTQATVAPAAIDGTLPNLTRMIKSNRDAVVNIRVKGESSKHGFMGRGMDDMHGLPEELREFFKRLPQNPHGGSMPRSRSQGSGFIVSKDGYIVTNAHVIDGASEITVSLNDQRELKATIVGKDKLSDIALLKVQAEGLPHVQLGDSSNLEVGQWVVAIGAPFGLEHTATQGIVSALSRSLPSETYVPFIQTDAAVNPGNSGGPLFDLQGRVIGVNSQIYSRSGGYMGVSFAIPINVVKNVTNQLKDGGKVSRGWLGVEIQSLGQGLANSFQLKSPHGALVAAVQPSSPADKAGLQAGDVITSFGGKPVKNVSDLPLLVGNTPIGQKVDVTVMRQGVEKVLNAKIDKLASKGSGEPEVLAKAEKGSLGVAVSPLEDVERTSAKVKSRGVKVQRVIMDSPAERAGLKQGDIILAVNGRDIATPVNLKEMIQKADASKPLAVLLMRDDRTRFIAVNLDS